MLRQRNSAALLVVAGLCACAGTHRPPDPPTLRSLEGRSIELPADKGVLADETATIAAYREYLDKAPQEMQRPEALRRLGDLEMESADARSGSGPSASAEAAEYRKAVERYQDLLRNYPASPGKDHVMYQLAHAYELSGDLDGALRVLDHLVQEFPHTPLLEEAQFRRGELLFTTRHYDEAEQAYGTLLRGRDHTPFYERALYMQGWSRYKQGRLEDALQSFFAVLDLKLIARPVEGGLDAISGLSRADRELVEDTLRVTSLSLENLQGADSIPAYMGSALRRDYEYRIYEQLGELYLRQERTKDAADTFSAFAHRHPLDPQAPLLQARVIEIYQQGGFDNLVLESKKDYVEGYGAASAFRRANVAAWARVAPVIRTDLIDLAHHYHAAAQKGRKAEDVTQAIHWYRELLAGFPADPQAAQENFLLAELLFEDGRFAEAAPEYEKSAYHYLPHAKSADAGYAALLAYKAMEKAAAAGDRAQIQAMAIESALRFGDAFPADARAGVVLADAAEKLYGAHDFERAIAIGRQVLAMAPAAAPAQQRVAWTVIAHASFDSGAFASAEKAYAALLAMLPAQDPARGALTERLAAAVYKQGELARGQGRPHDAVDNFLRVAKVAPDSPVRASAQFDAAAVLIEIKDWPRAAQILQDFRSRYPDHRLQPEVVDKLAVVYTESGQWQGAAGEFERLAARKGDVALARSALWQAAELYEKAGNRAEAARVYESYIQKFPEPLAPTIEARARLVQAAAQDGNGARALRLQRELVQAEQAGGAGRNERTRFLGATAALALAAPAYEEYRKVALVEPLKKQLKLKKARLEEVLKAYTVAANYGVADIATAATFQTAQLYQDFSQALLTSERPKGLSADETEQYNVLLEEQAFPFEEKAIAVHEINARHSAQGIYDQWVRSSYSALAKLRPVRFGKNETSEEAIDAIR